MSELQSPKATKRALCNVLEALAGENVPPNEKHQKALPHLYRHAVALAEERSRWLPGTAHDELVSSVGERVVAALGRLDWSTPPAQQATFLDGQIHHALADAGRAADRLGRGPRALRRRYEATCETMAQANGALPAFAAQQEVLDDLVGPAKPVLRLLVGQGMAPEEAVARTSSIGHSASEDPAEVVATASAQRQIAKAIAAHPDQAVREYLFRVATGLSARRPRDFHARLGPTIPELISSLLLKEHCG